MHEPRVRFGIIGCGGIGRWHARTIRSLPDVTLIAVADSDPQASSQLAHSFGAAAHTTAGLLTLAEVQVVSICTPPSTHVGLIEAAARSGKHVLVEKPLALDLTEADRALSACEDARVHLGVVHQQRARSATQALKQLIENDTFGQPLLASATHAWYRTQELFAADNWRGDVSAGGGLLLDQAIHAIDLLVWFLGAPRWVSGSTATLTDRFTAEDSCVASMGFAGGAVATLAASSATNLMRDDITIDLAGTRGGFRLEIRDYDQAEIVHLHVARANHKRAVALSATEIESLIQEHGGLWRKGPRSLRWKLAAVIADRERGRRSFRAPRSFVRRLVDRAAQLETGELQGHAAILAGMAEAARGHGRPLVTGEDARHSIAVIESIRQSQAAGGCRVELGRYS